MPRELYRTYEVLIEESVAPTHPKRGRTGKNDAYNAVIHRALRATNDLFQDAVCYYTIMLASLASETKDSKARSLNPLWQELVRGNYETQAKEIVHRFSCRYTSCAELTSLENFRESETGTQLVFDCGVQTGDGDQVRLANQQIPPVGRFTTS